MQTRNWETTGPVSVTTNTFRSHKPVEFCHLDQQSSCHTCQRVKEIIKMLIHAGVADIKPSTEHHKFIQCGFSIWASDWAEMVWKAHQYPAKEILNQYRAADAEEQKLFQLRMTWSYIQSFSPDEPFSSWQNMSELCVFIRLLRSDSSQRSLNVNTSL